MPSSYRKELSQIAFYEIYIRDLVTSAIGRVAVKFGKTPKQVRKDLEVFKLTQQSTSEVSTPCV